MLCVHNLGGLTKFHSMATWLSSLTSKLIQEAISGPEDMLDTFAQSDSFLMNMVTEQDCQDIYIRTHSQLQTSLANLTGRFLDN